jgi:hypothetical protein
MWYVVIDAMFMQVSLKDAHVDEIMLRLLEQPDISDNAKAYALITLAHVYGDDERRKDIHEVLARGDISRSGADMCLLSSWWKEARKI